MSPSGQFRPYPPSSGGWVGLAGGLDGPGLVGLAGGRGWCWPRRRGADGGRWVAGAVSGQVARFNWCKLHRLKRTNHDQTATGTDTGEYRPGRQYNLRLQSEDSLWKVGVMRDSGGRAMVAVRWRCQGPAARHAATGPAGRTMPIRCAIVSDTGSHPRTRPIRRPYRCPAAPRCHGDRARGGHWTVILAGQRADAIPHPS